jgi:hypothetical protein
MDLPPRWMYVKAGLFVLGGILAAAGLLLQSPRLQTALLLTICVWCFARAYYFAFYVIEHYIDPEYHFAGLVSAVRWILDKGGRK